MTGRRNCPVCGEIYNMYFKPPKMDTVCDDHPEVQLNHRADDNEETVQARLATYEEKTRPLLDYYRAATSCMWLMEHKSRKSSTVKSKRL